MRHVILPLLLLLTLGANARNFYVSAAGSNSNDGLSANTAWQTIAKVNSSFASIAAGDSILFRKGDVFYGALVISKSGSSGKPIVIGSYGTASAKPVISGFTTLSSWTLVSTGIYQASVPAAKTTLNLVTVNGQPKAMGRYPNIDAANGGYLSYESFVGTTSITDAQLTSATNWTGAEVAIRKNLWLIDRCKITSHLGTTITYTSPSIYGGTVGYGYFIQNDARTLDQFGEWFLNKTSKQLQMYFGTASPSAYSIKAATLDTLLTINTKSYITVNGISFEGANANTFYLLNSSYINILNCDINNAGSGGIWSHNTSNFLIDNVTTNNTLSTGIFALSYSSTNTTIRNCEVKNNGIIPGMGESGGNAYKGIRAESGGNLLIEYNRLDTIGYTAMEFQGSNVIVRNNVVNYFTFVKDDGGGIYSYASGTITNPGPVYTNRLIQNNIVMNAIGAPNGRSSAKLYASGIYLDGRTMNVDVIGNTCFNVAKNGIHCNNPENVNVRNNTSYNNLNEMSVAKWAWGYIKNLNIKNNIFYTRNDQQRHFHYLNAALNEPTTTTLDQAVKSMGTIDSNYYSNINEVGFDYEVYPYTGGAGLSYSLNSMDAWKNFSGYDGRAKKVTKIPTLYKLNSLVGANKFTNSTFTSNITGVTLYGSNVAAAWDNTGKISGGSVKMSFSAPAANKYGTLHAGMGPVSATKNYIFRVTTLGTTVNGIIRAYIRKTASPYTSLTPVQCKAFGTTKTTHEFMFEAPTTDAAGGSFVLEIEQNSGTTYIDNIEFYEANVTTYKPDDQLRFEYNDTRAAKTISLGANYKGVDGTLYSGTITLQPFTSAILIQDTGTVVTIPDPVVSALTASSTAANISCFSGSTNVTVSASGGKSPYTGTGTYTVTAGKGSVELAAKTPTAGAYTALYYGIGAISSSKNYIIRFSTTRSTGTANLLVSFRQTHTPFATVTAKQSAVAGTSRIDHQFFFSAPASQDAASFQIEVEETAGITYLDNIAVFEANSAKQIVSANLYPYGQFETDIRNLFAYSGSTVNHTIAWNNTSKISSTYYYPVKDAAGDIAVAEVKTSQPAAALKVAAKASSTITISGGTTTVTVSATGGTAPYKGTGTFTVGVGTFTYTVTDANGCSATATITLSLTLAKSTASKSTADTTTALQRTIVGVTDNTIKVTASPNPTTSSFKLYAQGGTSEKVAVIVYNTDGRILYQTTGVTNSTYTFGSSFTQGVYIVKVIQGTASQTLKLIKSN